MTDETSSQPPPTPKSFALNVPVAIVIAGALIAAAVYFGTGKSPDMTTGAGQKTETVPAAGQAVGQVRAVTDSDHILGAKHATVTVIEYSDLECPFCKRFHPTMQQLLREYPNDVRWVYRHFPLDAIHSKARKEAEATECAAELGGNEKFWAYVDRLFAVTPSNNNLDEGELPKIAEFVGINRTEFETCLRSGKYAQHVADDLADAQAAGARGTPYSVIMGADGQKLPLSGAQPYEAVKQLVEQALKSK